MYQIFFLNLGFFLALHNCLVIFVSSSFIPSNRLTQDLFKCRPEFILIRQNIFIAATKKWAWFQLFQICFNFVLYWKVEDLGGKRTQSLERCSCTYGTGLKTKCQFSNIVQLTFFIFYPPFGQKQKKTYYWLFWGSDLANLGCSFFKYSLAIN